MDYTKAIQSNVKETSNRFLSIKFARNIFSGFEQTATSLPLFVHLVQRTYDA